MLLIQMGGFCTKTTSALEVDGSMPEYVETNPFDIDTLMDELMDIETVNETICMTKDELINAMTRLKKAFENFDCTSMNLHSHSITGVGSMMACSIIRSSAIKVERYAKSIIDSNDTMDMDLMKKLISELDTEILHVVSYIENHYLNDMDV